MSSTKDQGVPQSPLLPHKRLVHKGLVPSLKATGEEMEGIRPADPKIRAEHNAETALLTLFRLDLATMYVRTAWPVLYNGGWIPKQLKHTPSRATIYEPVDRAAYTASVIERAAAFIQN
ncbi:hypothetical protein MMC34_006383 [Xylographa carneopallida]|nr:hypothetical protein [Xylographa carneopallida]